MRHFRTHRAPWVFNYLSVRRLASSPSPSAHRKGPVLRGAEAKESKPRRRGKGKGKGRGKKAAASE